MPTNAFVWIDNRSFSSVINNPDYCGRTGLEARCPPMTPSSSSLRTHENLLRGLVQPARGPRGRHLSRFEPARIVLQGLEVLKLTSVTSRIGFYEASGYLRYDSRNTPLGPIARPVSPSSQTYICRLRTIVRAKVRTKVRTRKSRLRI